MAVHGETSNSMKEEETVSQSALTNIWNVLCSPGCCVWPTVELGVRDEKAEEHTLQKIKKTFFGHFIIFPVTGQYKRY